MDIIGINSKINNMEDIDKASSGISKMFIKEILKPLFEDVEKNSIVADSTDNELYNHLFQDVMVNQVVDKVDIKKVMKQYLIEKYSVNED